MDDISASSYRIADIIGVIDSIAFQTNILALNAAVEGARAGEEGRGFAVVAGEVRALAQRSAAAARQIKDLIHTSVSKVELGTQLVYEAGSTMTDIVAQAQRVAHLIATISSATAAQTQDIAQVNGVVMQLDQATQQNAAMVEQSGAAAQTLRQQAKQLAAVVRVFRLAETAPAAQPLAPSSLEPVPARHAVPALWLRRSHCVSPYPTVRRLRHMPSRCGNTFKAKLIANKAVNICVKDEFFALKNWVCNVLQHR